MAALLFCVLLVPLLIVLLLSIILLLFLNVSRCSHPVLV
uniref:Uncharacterized protein n=1 Tax=Anguilla anguilla TaxID=7936 RepID=A0A0E9XUS8_ANGAN